MATTAKIGIPSRPGLWVSMSVKAGNLAQLGGIAVGALLMFLAANLPAPTAYGSR